MPAPGLATKRTYRRPSVTLKKTVLPACFRRVFESLCFYKLIFALCMIVEHNY